MTLKVVNGGLLLALAALRSPWMNGLRIGAYASDWTPDAASTISEVVPATFSGYVGLRTLNAWGAPTLDLPRGLIVHPPITWSHNGGPLQDYLWGYYIVDPAGSLVWAERVSDTGQPMNALGQFFQVTPRFTQRSEF